MAATRHHPGTAKPLGASLMGTLDSGLLGTRAGGRAATLFLHSGGGEARDGGPPPGRATGRSV